jgi:AraC-like DNA-binding protein
MPTPYFQDIEFLLADRTPTCLSIVDKSFPETFSIEFIQCGNMYYGVDGKKPRVTLMGPAIFWHHPRHTYQYGPTDKKGWHHHWILLKGQKARSLVENGFMQLSETGYMYTHSPDRVAGIFTELVALTSSPSPSSRGRGLILLEELLLLLEREQDLSKTEPGRRHQLTGLRKRIQESPFQSWDFESEAEKAGISESHFRRLFQQECGQSPANCLQNVRMQRAASMLMTQAHSIKEIAFLAGYSKPSAFTRAFQNYTGETPSSFRNTRLSFAPPGAES